MFPCIVQWWLLWFSAPTSLNNDLLNDGVILEIYNKVINMAVKTSFTIPFHKDTNAKTFLFGNTKVEVSDMHGWMGSEA